MLVGKVRDTQIMFSYLVQAQLVEAENLIMPPAQPIGISGLKSL